MIRFDGDYTMTIGGRGATSATTINVINPATEEILAEAPDAARSQLDEAVAAARGALPGWSAAPISERRQALEAVAAALEDHADDFARLFTLEQGRPLGKAREEILAGAFWCRAIAKQEIPVETNEDTPGRHSVTRHLPLGVVGGIVPWNYPIMLATWKIAPALLTGNTLVIKPSPYTPLTLLKLGELVRDKIPAGVLNVVSGGDRVGPWMTEHSGIDKISFTGSSATGRRVMAGAASTLKRVTLELGGNDAAIVMPDVDVAKVAEKLFWSAFSNSGQLCVATKRMYVHEDIYDAVSDALVARARQSVVGDGLQQGSDLGPIQNHVQFERVKNLISDAREQGLNFIAGGEVPDRKGYFIPVSIVDNPPEESRVVSEEAFGPVLPLLRFSDIDDVVARANASEYGLAGSIWTADEQAGIAIAERLETGTVWINEAQYLMPWTPFAGHKQSGVGVENALAGLLEYTIPQTITVRKPRPAA
jgi:acyl-CoA reductase-like NAD-dependent aldehyde dehydrogenase